MNAFWRAGQLCAAAILAAGLASANVIPTFTSVTGSGSLFTYSYGVDVDAFQFVVTGDELCFASVPGLTGSATAPSGWSASESPSSACPINSGVSVPNAAGSVLYIYTGSANIPSSTVIGTFTYQDTFGSATGTIAFGATSEKDSDSLPTANQGQIVGPTVSSTVPEPGTVALLGAGLLLFAFPKRRRA